MNFYSRGKLLISGEYLVLKGATSLAVPLTKGQTMKVDETAGEGLLRWRSCEMGKEWFTLLMRNRFFEIVETTDIGVAETLIGWLKAAKRLNPGFLDQTINYSVDTDLQFYREWGFGSSSSLLANLAEWSGTDPFKLSRKATKGSGYDVIAARKNEPFYFKLEKEGFVAENALFRPLFRNRLYFVYLGQKQNSQTSVEGFLEKRKQYRPEKRMISELSRLLAEAPSLKDFEYYMNEHNIIMSAVLKTPDLKSDRFADLNGEIKPLGAWGGDFAMMTWNEEPEQISTFLHNKGISTYFTFDELIKA
ncbi:MAG: hypothetical protein KDC05_07985 [Bacteroidales bacterium]|nr:hypothetical protein [Bacteroidales bacterium]